MVPNQISSPVYSKAVNNLMGLLIYSVQVIQAHYSPGELVITENNFLLKVGMAMPGTRNHLLCEECLG